MLLPSTTLVFQDLHLVELNAKVLKMDELNETEAIKLLEWAEETLAYTPVTDMVYPHFSKQFTDYQKYLVMSSILGRDGFEKRGIGLVVSLGPNWGISDITECAAVFGLNTFSDARYRLNDAAVIDISYFDPEVIKSVLKELMQCFENSQCKVSGLIYLPAYRDNLVATPVPQ